MCVCVFIYIYIYIYIKDITYLRAQDMRGGNKMQPYPIIGGA